MNNSFKPAKLIDLNKPLSIKEIQYILKNLSKKRYEYNHYKILLEDLGAKMPEIDFDLIEAIQAIYLYSQNNILLCKMTNAFNKYANVNENVWLYEPYFGEDKLCSGGYELELNFPPNLREKIIDISKKVKEENIQKSQNYAW